MTTKEKAQSEEVKAKVAQMIEFCKVRGFNAELVGCWIWVSFETKPDEAARKVLKDAGFRWSKRRGKWAHNCGVKTKSSQGNPWDKYDHKVVSGRIAS